MGPYPLGKNQVNAEINQYLIHFKQVVKWPYFYFGDSVFRLVCHFAFFFCGQKYLEPTALPQNIE